MTAGRASSASAKARNTNTDTPQVLLQHHLKKLRLPTFQSEYAKLAQQCAAESKDHVQCLLNLGPFTAALPPLAPECRVTTGKPT